MTNREKSRKWKSMLLFYVTSNTEKAEIKLKPLQVNMPTTLLGSNIEPTKPWLELLRDLLVLMSRGKLNI